MILGIQLYGPVAKQTLSMKELLAGLRSVGIDMVEPCISLDGKSGAPTFWQMDKCEEYFSLAKENGLKIISCHVSSEDYLKTIPQMCELCDKYGVKQIVVGMAGLSEIEIQKRAFVYRSLADVLKEHGAELLLHNGKPDMAAKIQGRTAYEYMVEICMGKLGMQFDTGWAARGGVNPLDFIQGFNLYGEAR